MEFSVLATILNLQFLFFPLCPPCFCGSVFHDFNVQFKLETFCNL